MSTWKGTREYGTVSKEDMSHETEIESSQGLSFSHITAGWKPAGSCMIWTDEEYGVFFTLDYARHGRRFTDREEAWNSYQEQSKRREEENLGRH